MSRRSRRRTGAARAALVAVYAAGLALFYYKYVPLVKDYQAALVPILLLAFVLAWRDLNMGTLFFIFAFPLINNLPYFFGIHEPSPQAPTALVLFLFYFLGFLAQRRSPTEDPLPGSDVVRPIALFLGIVIVSGLITFWRFANFAPFLSPRIFELITSSYGVRAGGALMSVVFNSLNYLTEFAFFMILVRYHASAAFLSSALRVLSASTLLALGFALVQHFGHPALGNNPVSIGANIINGTFKDALSFGAYLSIIGPFFLGVAFSTPRLVFKAASGMIAALSCFLIIYTGSKSGVVSLAAAVLVFAVMSAGLAFVRRRKRAAETRKKVRRNILIAALAGGLLLAGVVAAPIVWPKIENTLIFKRFRVFNYAIGWRMENLWKAAGDMMADHPLTGIGAGGYIIEVANYSDKYKTSEVAPESAENAILQVGAELGAVGLLALAWIIFAVARRMIAIVGFSHASTRSPGYAFFVYGALAGMTAFLLNAQAHTYIGSYEIKYAFWLMAGLALIAEKVAKERAPRPEDKPEAPEAVVFSPGGALRSARRYAIATAAVILAYGALHLWSSTHSLSLARRSEQQGIKQDFGLDKFEKTPDGREFRWTRGYGGWTLRIEKPVLVLPLHAAHPDIRTRPLIVRVFFTADFFRHKRLLGEIVLAEYDWRDVWLSVPDDVGKEGILYLLVSRTWNPLRTTGAPDPRNLGVAVGAARFEDR